jgi:hypothetical protein
VVGYQRFPCRVVVDVLSRAVIEYKGCIDTVVQATLSVVEIHLFSFYGVAMMTPTIPQLLHPKKRSMNP